MKLDRIFESSTALAGWIRYFVSNVFLNVTWNAHIKWKFLFHHIIACSLAHSLLNFRRLYIIHLELVAFTILKITGNRFREHLRMFFFHFSPTSCGSLAVVVVFFMLFLRFLVSNVICPILCCRQFHKCSFNRLLSR